SVFRARRKASGFPSTAVQPFSMRRAICHSSMSRTHLRDGHRVGWSRGWARGWGIEVARAQHLGRGSTVLGLRPPPVSCKVRSLKEGAEMGVKFAVLVEEFRNLDRHRRQTGLSMREAARYHAVFAILSDLLASRSPQADQRHFLRVPRPVTVTFTQRGEAA